MQTSGGTVTPEPERWTIEELCDLYLGGRPSDAVLQLLKSAEGQRSEVRDFLERAFRLMALSKFDPRDLSPGMARFFVVFAPSILPGVWGGIVPPITMPGRHKKIDAYLRSNPWANFDPGTVLLDLGCGFPPQTSMDAAEAFPEWQIVGADPPLTHTSSTTNAKTMPLSTPMESSAIFKPAAQQNFSACTPIGMRRFRIFRRPSRNCSPAFPPMTEGSPPRSTTACVCSAILCTRTSDPTSDLFKEDLGQATCRKPESYAASMYSSTLTRIFAVKRKRGWQRFFTREDCSFAAGTTGHL